MENSEKELFKCMLFKVNQKREMDLIAEIDNVKSMEAGVEKTILHQDNSTFVAFYLRDAVKCFIAEFDDFKLINCQKIMKEQEVT